MEIDIRDLKEGMEPSIIRWRTGVFDDRWHRGTINYMKKDSCLITDEEGDTVIVYMSDIDNLIKALQKYKELYS